MHCLVSWNSRDKISTTFTSKQSTLTFININIAHVHKQKYCPLSLLRQCSLSLSKHNSILLSQLLKIGGPFLKSVANMFKCFQESQFQLKYPSLSLCTLKILIRKSFKQFEGYLWFLERGAKVLAILMGAQWTNIQSSKNYIVVSESKSLILKILLLANIWFVKIPNLICEASLLVSIHDLLIVKVSKKSWSRWRCWFIWSQLMWCCERMRWWKW